MKKIIIIIAVAMILFTTIIGGLYVFSNVQKGRVTDDAIMPTNVQEDRVIDDVIMPIEETMDNDNDHKACEVDSDCVPATCCHATDVINKEFAPDCSVVMCTMSCETVLDCGQSVPACVSGVCKIDIK